MTAPTLFDLSGKTALVTGSSGGLGLAMARGLAEAGARVVLNGRDGTKLATTAKAFEAEGCRALTRAFDVADDAAVRCAFERFDAEGVAIDILVNNAGVQLRKPMLDLTTDEWRGVLDVHLTAAFQVGREAARRMIARGRGGKIINIGSLMSEVARATIAPYTAAKGGMKMLTRSMSAEWAQHNIQANAIGPGYIATEMNRALLERSEIRRLGQGPHAVRTLGPAGGSRRRDDLPRVGRLRLHQRPDRLCRRRHACGPVVQRGSLLVGACARTHRPRLGIVELPRLSHVARGRRSR